MSSRFLPRLWLLAPVCALAFLAWTTTRRLSHVEAVNALAPWTPFPALVTANSPTGHTGGQRVLIVPERNEKSFEWIAQTQVMLAHHAFQLHHVDYDNVPSGRPVESTSLYRWWLATLARVDRVCTGQPLGAAVERAALYADPLLLALVVLAFGLFAARNFGAVASGMLSLGLVAFFPLGAAFLPGAPDDLGATALLALGSVLPLLAALRPQANPARCFSLAGIVGGVGVWLQAPTQIPILFGIFLGGLFAAGLARRGDAPVVDARLWRHWAGGGSTIILVGYLLENFPDHLASWRLDSVHPLYGVAWLGLAEGLIVATQGFAAPASLRRGATLAHLLLAATAIASVPLVMWKTGTQVFFARDLLWPRLSSLPNSPFAASVWAWVRTDAAGGTVAALLAPLGLIVVAGWFIFCRPIPSEHRLRLALALGPALVALGFACVQLRWWSVADGTLLALLVALTLKIDFAPAAAGRWLAALLAAVAMGAGVCRLLPPRDQGDAPALTAFEAQEVIERHLAHWLAARTAEPGAVVYAPPHVTTALCYYGGLRGLGTFAPENRAGFGTSLAAAAPNTMEEAENLLRGRGVRYLVIPSWDPFFDNFAALYLAKNFSNRSSLLVRELRRWNVPLWLRPVPYQLPVGGAFEGQTVRVFEFVDEQAPAAATARLAEYLTETGDAASAAVVAEQLKRFPGDIGALAARVQVSNALGESAAATSALGLLEARLQTGADRYLPWDRRVSLALALAQADRVEPAVIQARRCVAEMDGDKLRTLSTGSLYNFQVLLHAVGLSISDPSLQALARNLLPMDLRKNLN